MFKKIFNYTFCEKFFNDYCEFVEKLQKLIDENRYKVNTENDIDKMRIDIKNLLDRSYYCDFHITVIVWNNGSTVNIDIIHKTSIAKRIIDAYGFYQYMETMPNRDFLKFRYGKDEGRYIDFELKKMMKDKENLCVNNIRVADIENEFEMFIYEKIQSEGCCGDEDIMIEHKSSKKKFKIGCNFS